MYFWCFVWSWERGPRTTDSLLPFHNIGLLARRISYCFRPFDHYPVFSTWSSLILPPPPPHPEPAAVVKIRQDYLGLHDSWFSECRQKKTTAKFYLSTNNWKVSALVTMAAYSKPESHNVCTVLQQLVCRVSTREKERAGNCSNGQLA